MSIQLKLIDSCRIRCPDVYETKVDLELIDPVLVNPAYDFGGALVYDTVIDYKRFYKAVEETLKYYPVLSGRLEREASEPFIDVGFNDGVHIEIWESSEHPQFSELSRAELKSLTCEHKTLCSLKLTLFPNASVLGYSWVHAAGDGFSVFDFLKWISKAYEGTGQPECRSLSRQPRKSLAIEQFKEKVAGQTELDDISVFKCLTDTERSTFMRNLTWAADNLEWFEVTYSKDELKQIKDAAMATKPSNCEFVSTMDALVAHWIHKVSLKRWEDTHKQPDWVGLTFPYNLRFTFPDYWDEKYIGNCFGMTFTKLQYSAFASETAVGTIAASIRQKISGIEIDHLCQQEAWKSLQEPTRTIENKYIVNLWNNCFLMSDWRKFPVFNGIYNGCCPIEHHLLVDMPLPWLTIIVPTAAGGVNMVINLPKDMKPSFEKMRDDHMFHDLMAAHLSCL